MPRSSPTSAKSSTRFPLAIRVRGSPRRHLRGSGTRGPPGRSLAADEVAPPFLGTDHQCHARLSCGLLTEIEQMAHAELRLSSTFTFRAAVAVAVAADAAHSRERDHRPRGRAGCEIAGRSRWN